MAQAELGDDAATLASVDRIEALHDRDRALGDVTDVAASAGRFAEVLPPPAFRPVVREASVSILDLKANDAEHMRVAAGHPHGRCSDPG